MDGLKTTWSNCAGGSHEIRKTIRRTTNFCFLGKIEEEKQYKMMNGYFRFKDCILSRSGSKYNISSRVFITKTIFFNTQGGRELLNEHINLWGFWIKYYL